LVLRETTERPEGIEAGVAKLVGTSRQRITEEAEKILDDPDEHRKMSFACKPYGDGHAAERIADALERWC
jgi:UDP-N-acetylglucosamine 2-epimerase (non-hydrolysing)